MNWSRDGAVGVGQVADVEDDVVVVQILDQRVRRVQRPRLVVRELVRPVPLRLPLAVRSGVTMQVDQS